MDTSDVPSTPERRPVSSIISRSTSSTATSSHQARNEFFALASPLSHATGSSNHDSTRKTETRGSGSLEIGRTISPFETLECERLVGEIRAFHPDYQDVDDDPKGRPPGRSESLEAAIYRASSTIRYNAKWFSAHAISKLLRVTLHVASNSSSSSAVLYAALELIDSIGTYSLLPPRDGLDICVRFIAATYYSASRANKTKRLAIGAWSTLQRIMESHLGYQCIVALLNVIGDDSAYISTKSGYAHVTGVIKLITDYSLFKETKSRLPVASPFELLVQMRAASLEGDEYVREHVTRLVTDILNDSPNAERLAEDGGLEQVLEIAQTCAAYAPSNPASKRLVEATLRWASSFEPRHHATLAFLCVDVGLPLTPQLHREMVLSWRIQIVEDDWPDRFDNLVSGLCKSASYLDELSLLARQTFDVFRAVDDEALARTILRRYHHTLNDPATDFQAADIMCAELVNAFDRSLNESITHKQQTLLFDAVCEIAHRSVDAARFLFRIRADVTGALYLRSSIGPTASPQRELGALNDASRPFIERWHSVLLAVISEGAASWATYDCILTRLPSLLSNHKMFEDKMFIQQLLKALCEQTSTRTAEPPIATGMTKTSILSKHIHILTVMISYHRNLSKAEMTNLISIFNNTAGAGDHSISIQCIHALTICCYEIPELITSYMDDIIDKMSKLVTQRFLAIHVLQFIAGLSRLPDLHRNFTLADYKKIFGVCHSYLQSSRGVTTVISRRTTPTSDRSSGNRKEEALPEYVYALAHHVIIFWYLSLMGPGREALKPFITGCLKYKEADGNEIVEDQGLVTIDMMDRVDAEALDEPQVHDGETFSRIDGRLVKRHRLVGLLLISTETALRTGRTLVTIRRPSGTTERMLGTGRAIITTEADDSDHLTVVDEDPDGRIYGSISIPRPDSILASKVLTLEDNDAVRRAIQSFDRTSALDSHKAGVIYIGERQVTEERVLQNISGSPDYREFLRGLGRLQSLQGATFNTQGLDRAENADGEHTIVWNNDVTEVVFHVTTMMPNAEDAGINTANKKRHIGNDHVNIVFNNSGSSLDFTTLYNMFPGQLTFVYIVITPSARTSFVQARTENVTTDKKDRFYKVQVVARPDYPNLAPAAEQKVVSGASLPSFVRNLALNDCIISLMWSPRNDSSQYPSSWSYRMDQLKRMGQRYGKG